MAEITPGEEAETAQITVEEHDAERERVRIGLSATIQSHIEEANADETNADFVRAYENLAAIQIALVDCDYPLDDDGTYEQFGLVTKQAFDDRISQCCLFAAQNEFDQAKYLESLPKTELNAGDDYAFEAYEEALLWLKRSGRPLFSAQTYKELGTKYPDFFDDLRAAHMDAVRQKIKICQRIMDQGGDNQSGYIVIKQVRDDHLPRLGVYGVDDAIAARIECKAEELEALYLYFCQKCFQELLPKPETDTKVVKLKIAFASVEKDVADNASTEEKIIQCASLLTGTLDEDPKTWEGTGYTKQSFDQAFVQAIRGRLHACLLKIKNDAPNAEEFYAILDEIQSLENLCPEAETPEGVDPELMHDNFWMHDVFMEYGFATMTQCIEQTSCALAATNVHNAFLVKGARPRDMYDQFVEAENLMMDARIPLARDDVIQSIGIDTVKYRTTMMYVAQDAANREWGMTFVAAESAGKRMDNVECARVAYHRYVGDHELQKQTEFDGDDLKDRARFLAIRYAEEQLADARVCFDLTGAYAILNDALQTLSKEDMSLDDPDVQDEMGMTYPGTAESFLNWHKLLEIEDTWRQSKYPNTTLQDRFELQVGFLQKLEGLTDEEKLRVITRAEPNANYDEIITRTAHELVREAYREFTFIKDDTMRADQLLYLVKQAMLAISPDVLSNDFVFLRYFRDMGISRADLVAEINEYTRRAERITQPVKKQFDTAAGYGAMLATAMKPENKGEAALGILKDVSAKLNALGRSIHDPSVLDAAGLTPQTLQEFVDTQLIEAARFHVDSAQAKAGMPITMRNVKDHASEDYNRALLCVLKTSYPPFADDAYQRIGFVSRDDFMTHCKDSLLDLIVQLEERIQSNAMAAGPEKLIEMLSVIRSSRILLGIDTEEKNADIGNLDGVKEKNILHDTRPAAIRHTIKEVGYAAGRHMIKSDRSNSWKYKSMRQFLTFVGEMRATDWKDQEKVGEINTEYSTIIARRLENIVDMFQMKKDGLCKVKSDDPGRWVRVAFAIDGVNKSHGLEEFPWFQGLFQKHGYESFKHFCFMAAEARVRQITQRVNYNMTDVQNAADPSKYVDIYRDVERIENLVDGELVSLSRLNSLLESVDLDENWPHTTALTAMVNALPIFVARAQDPILSLDERETAMMTAQRGRVMLSKHGGLNHVTNVDWGTFDKAYKDCNVRMAAMFMANDILFRDLEQADVKMSIARGILNNVGAGFNDAQTLLHIGLNEEEVARVLYLTPYAELKRSIEDLGAVPPSDIYGIGDTVYRIYGYANKQNIDFTNPHVAEELGYSDEVELMEVLDHPAFKFLKAMTDALPDIEGDTESVSKQLIGIFDFLDTTGLEKRHPENAFAENNIPLRAELEAIKSRAEGTLDTAQQYDPRKSRANATRLGLV